MLARAQVFPLLQTAFDERGVRSTVGARHRVPILWWRAREQEIGWAHLHQSERVIACLRVCYLGDRPTLKEAQDLGLVKKPPWNWLTQSDPDFQYRNKIEFLFLLDEFRAVVASWIVGHILAGAPGHPQPIPEGGYPLFVSPQASGPACVWTRKADAVYRALRKDGG